MNKNGIIKIVLFFIVCNVISACSTDEIQTSNKEVSEKVSGINGPLEKVCGYRSTIKILFCPFIKLNNG